MQLAMDLSRASDVVKRCGEMIRYRQERLGKIASDQLARDGALIQKNPLLIQKVMADKLSDKISVIIAPPPSDGGFIGAASLGSGKQNKAARNAGQMQQTPEYNTEEGE